MGSAGSVIHLIQNLATLKMLTIDFYNDFHRFSSLLRFTAVTSLYLCQRWLTSVYSRHQ